MTRLQNSFNVLIGLASAVLLSLPIVLRAACQFNWADILLGLQFQYACVSLALFLLAMILRRSRTAMVLSLIATVVNLVPVVGLYIPRSPPADGSAIHLRLLSLNVLHDNVNFDEVIQYVRKENPDIAVFQEATGPWPKELSELGKDYPFHYRSDEIQIEVFSKLPINEMKLDLVGEYRGSIRWKTTLNGDSICMIASHCYPQGHYGKQGFEWRNVQLTQRIPELVNHSNEPVVLMGDLNATPWSPYFRTLLEKSGLRNGRKGFGVSPTAGKTEFGSFFCVPYDHCLVTERWTVQQFFTGPYLGSDHLPIVVDLELSN